MVRVLLSYKEEIENAKMPAGRKQVLLAGLKLFSENGFHATTTAEIANQAGVSEGTIYKYFHSKNDLLNKLLNPILHEIQQNFFLRIDDYHDLNTMLSFVVKDRVQFALVNFDFFKLILQEILTNQQFFKLFKIDFTDGNVKSYLERLKDRFKEINQELTPVQIFRIFFGPIYAYTFERKILKVASTNETQDLELVKRQIMAGLTK
ncbi:TetR/AcrR family transcriptional regulator [Lactobacillus bombicola]|uniref:TetR/AcrR family transcriptional regulator n=1 Tax=Lactobacillus bombicola TaxID=1505723 RepID=UPI000E598828|nr:TetR/AcrR family transcriptional regulator [Lactobacillus bombicola]RHW49321.1 TetR/AcrR family transcriptional regulator [Lactobacillus bombicola]